MLTIWGQRQLYYRKLFCLEMVFLIFYQYQLKLLIEWLIFKEVVKIIFNLFQNKKSNYKNLLFSWFKYWASYILTLKALIQTQVDDKSIFLSPGSKCYSNNAFLSSNVLLNKGITGNSYGDFAKGENIFVVNHLLQKEAQGIKKERMLHYSSSKLIHFK